MHAENGIGVRLRGGPGGGRVAPRLSKPYKLTDSFSTLAWNEMVYMG